jgi:hypothetical protein
LLEGDSHCADQRGGRALVVGKLPLIFPGGEWLERADAVEKLIGQAGLARLIRDFCGF